jgi:hypothetical protein
MYGDFRSMKSAATEGIVEFGAVQSTVRPRLKVEHGVPRLHLVEPVEPALPVHQEQVGKLRVIGTAATLTRSVERVGWGEEAANRFHIVAEVYDAHCQRDLFATDAFGEPVPVPSLECEAQSVSNSGGEIEPLHQHVANLATRSEVVHRPLVGALLDRPHDLLTLLGGASGGREPQHVAHDLGWVRGVVHQRLGADGNLVTEDGGDLMRVASATDIPQQRHPVDSSEQVSVETRFLT